MVFVGFDIFENFPLKNAARQLHYWDSYSLRLPPTIFTIFESVCLLPCLFFLKTAFRLPLCISLTAIRSIQLRPSFIPFIIHPCYSRYTAVAAQAAFPTFVQNACVFNHATAMNSHFIIFLHYLHPWIRLKTFYGHRKHCETQVRRHLLLIICAHSCCQGNGSLINQNIPSLPGGRVH